MYCVFYKVQYIKHIITCFRWLWKPFYHCLKRHIQFSDTTTSHCPAPRHIHFHLSDPGGTFSCGQRTSTELDSNTKKPPKPHQDMVTKNYQKLQSFAPLVADGFFFGYYRNLTLYTSSIYTSRFSTLTMGES